MMASALAVVLAASALAIAPAAHAASASCPALTPKHLKLKVSKAGTRGTLTWRMPAQRPAKTAFRVLRDGAVVGQTSGRSMRLALSPSRAARIEVVAVLAGRPTRCRATLRVRGSGRGPAAVTGLFTAPRRDGTVTLSWEPATPGAHPVRRYRVVRAGRTVRTTRKRSVRVRLPKEGRVRVQVAPIDAGGRAGRRSRSVILERGHVRPTRPRAPAVTPSGTLSWARSRAFGARIRGYRIRHVGRTVASVKGTRLPLSKLKAGKTYRLRVIAVDALGWTSQPSQTVTVTPERKSSAAPHVAPGAPGAPEATSVTDTALGLRWTPSSLPAGSRLRGYRIMRDGEVVTQVPATEANLGNLAPKAAHDWTVAAVDTRGYASAPSPATRVVQADPPPTTGGVHAYLLASTDSSFEAFRAFYRHVGVVYPTFFDCNTSTGAIEGHNDDLIVRYAQDRKVKVLPRFNCQRTTAVHKVLTDPTLRTQWLDTLPALAEQHGWDGVNLDFEAIAAADRDLLTAFVAELADRLHARGKLLSQAVSPKSADVPNHPRSTAFDYVALSQYVDTMFVMAWGVHWSTSAPGPQDDFPWVKAIGQYVASMPRKDKFVMGTMLYGMDWPAGGGAANPGVGLHFPEVEALLQRTGATPVWDAEKRSWHVTYTEAGVPHDVWYSDAAAVGERVALARDLGLRVGFWRLGQEDPRVWSDPRLPAAG